MKVFEGFTNIFKSDDYEDEDFINEDDYFSDGDDYEETKKSSKKEAKKEKKGSIFSSFKKEKEKEDEDMDYYDDEDDFTEPDITYNSSSERDFAESAHEKPAHSSHRASSTARVERTPERKVVPLHSSSKGFEVVVIHPESMEDGNEITDTLLAGKAVVLNLEGINPDIAQRIIDYTAGSCYAMRGVLQKISNYIFLVAPSGVDVSGDFQNVFGAHADVSSFSKDFRFS